MKISGVGGAKGAGSTGKAKKKSEAKGSDFAQQLREAAEVGETSGVVDTGNVAGVDTILAVQAGGDATEEKQRRQARQYGEDLLDRLERIRGDLLVGAIPKERLTNLAQTMRAQRKRIDDPRLKEILEEIELRAEVEIAKLTRRP